MSQHTPEPTLGLDTWTRAIAFEQPEFDRRVSDVRARMQARGLEVLLLFAPENVTYLTGYESIGYSSFQCLLLPLEGEPVHIIREMELGVARTTTWLNHFVTTSDTDDPVARTRSVLNDWGWLSRRLGVESTSPFLSAKTYLALQHALAGSAVSDGSGLVEEVRRIKSNAELAYIRKACRVTAEGMRAALDAVREGVTENQVAVAAYTAMVGGGSDFLAADPIVTSGPRSGIAHTTFANRRLGPGDTVLIELGSSQHRYFGALMRTAVVGTPDTETLRLAAVVREALDAAIDAIRPGVTCGDVDQACRGVIERAGYEPNFRKRTGYSIGIAFAPDWGEGHILSLKQDDPTRLEAGMTFHMPPALRIFQQRCVGLSETVLVTDGGCEVLTSLPRELRVSA